ncbi:MULTISPECIES: ABC transporter ATP-binding protein [unclassified Nonomuraea]|uniref:ABC transporter ATP-binding protein n=1 Tax=unclassified Nonomuraea TaxID=2593643 RepID=UPI0034017E9A
MSTRDGVLDATTTRPEVKLAFRDVAMIYQADGGPVTALKDVNFDVRAREFLCVVGSSGGGKSTLLHIAAGLVRQTSGEVLLDGHPVRGAGADRAMVFQDDAVFPWLRVHQNVEYGLKAQGLPKKQRCDRVEKMLALVGLRDWRLMYPRQLSGGMRKRVDIARAFAGRADVVLMDEPFGGLDTVTRASLQEEVLRIWDTERKTIVFVTHDLEEAVFLADRIVLLRPSHPPLIYDNDLPRPRTDELRTSRDLQDRRRELSRLMLQAPDPDRSSHGPSHHEH